MKVAVLLPVYNGEQTIKKAIESLLIQTHKVWRLVLVDNNCTDKTVKIVSDLMDEAELEWTLLTCKEPGIVPALNKGLFTILGEGSSDLIARLDADDQWEASKLAKQVQFMTENPDVQICGTQILRVSNDNGVSQILNGQMTYPVKDEEIKRSLLTGHNAIAHPSVVFRPEVILRTGGYDNTYPIAEDYHLWLKALPWF